MALYITFKKGEVGKELIFDSLKAAGALVDLTSWTITLAIAKSKTATPVVTGQTVAKRTQSGDTLGCCYHTLTSETANIPVGIYKACELKAVNGSQVRYWPVNADDKRTYFVIEVQQPIS